MKTILSVRRAADIAGVTASYIRMLLEDEVLKPGDVEGMRTVTRKSLEAWMEKRLRREREANRE